MERDFLCSMQLLKGRLLIPISVLSRKRLLTLARLAISRSGLWTESTWYTRGSNVKAYLLCQQMGAKYAIFWKIPSISATSDSRIPLKMLKISSSLRICALNRYQGSRSLITKKAPKWWKIIHLWWWRTQSIGTTFSLLVARQWEAQAPPSHSISLRTTRWLLSN
jgi:hypothetical protein